MSKVMDDVSELDSEERNFHHPYEPYEIQKQFMNAVYDCLEQGKVGIFESPTGTGKSLSLICGSLTWLREHKARQLSGGQGFQVDNDTPEWMLEYEREEKRRSMFRHLQEREEKLALIQAKEDKARLRYERDENPSKRRKTTNHATDDLDDAQFLLDDYESDQDQGTKVQNGKNGMLGLSEETQKLMAKLAGAVSQREADVQVEEETKIIYCSRTHSQLSQFAQELGRVKLPSMLADLDPGGNAKGLEHRVKYLTLGSRKNLCINPRVSKLASSTAINERCLELQQSGTSTGQKCPHLPNKESEALVHDFRDYTMARIRDIEDLGNLGRKMSICPYYASRAAIQPAEIVTVPYPTLLQKSTRETLSLSLKGHVVIIDEAHNLMDAVSNLHSARVSLDELLKSRAQLGIYLEKFRTRLKGKNRVYIAQLVRVLDSLSNYLQSKIKEGASSGIVRVVELMAGKGADQINLHKLVHYLNESKLARKVDRYLVHTESTSPVKKQVTASTPLLIHIQAFLHALSNPEAEGRFFYSMHQPGDGASDQIALEYMLLDPTHHFKEIVEEARAVILAGGTMSPMGDYTHFLLDYIPSNSLLTLSCGHVIPPSNLLAFPQAEGPTGVTLDFSFTNQKSIAVIMELGRTISELAKVIPDGLVVFFPSYALLSSITQHWQKHTSAGNTLWNTINTTKRIFFESKSGDPKTDSAKNSAESLLAQYSTHIKTGQGALLLAVMGGSLSEGINFADALGRGVVVVGMPYPNPHTPEWKAKLEYVEQRNRKTGGRDPKAASRDYYENVCMRSVNQTIGRAIRHRHDYATIVLLDQRYRRPHVKSKLPAWIQGSLTSFPSFSQAKDGVEGFFKEKQGSQ